MRTCRWLTTAVVVLATVAVAAPNPKLTQGKRQLEDLELDAAAKSLIEALALPGNDRATLLEILEAQGITYGTLGKSDKAREAFKQLLVLDPAHAITGDQPPRVRTPFYEAKDWATKSGALGLDPTVDKTPTGLTLSVKLRGDVFNLARTVVFHLLTAPDKPARIETQKLDKTGKVSVKVDGDTVKWWVDLMGERDATLLSLGSAAKPNVEAPVVVVKPPDDTLRPPPPPPPPPEITQKPTWMRPTGIGLLCGGAAAGIVGGVLGYTSQDARNKVNNATKDANGVVTSMTQKEAAALDKTARDNALIANVLFGTAAALGATGLVFTLVGGPADTSGPQVTVAPAPGGVVVFGRF